MARLSPRLSSARLEPVATLAVLVVAGVALALVLQRGGVFYATAAGLAALTLAMALRFPYQVMVALLVAGVFAASYLELVPPLSGPVLLSVLALVCGLGVSFRTRFDFVGRPLVLVALGLAGLWMLGAVLVGRTTEGVALTGLATMAGVVQVAQTARGRRAVLFGLAVGSVVAALYGVFTVIAGQNPVLELGVRQGAQTDFIVSTARFGFARAVGAFSHPIMLGTFLGLGGLAALELARLKAIKDRTAVLFVVVAFSGQLATISRGPIVATLGSIAIWIVFGRRMSLRWRVCATAGVAALVVGALWLGGLKGDVGSLFGTSAGDALAGSTQYRIELAKALVQRLPHAPLLGFPNPDTATFLPGFRSLDNEIAYLGLTRGLLGLAVFGALLVVPIYASAVRRGPLVLSRLYVVLSMSYLMVVGGTVAYFGLLVFFLFVVLALCWVAIAAPSPLASVPPEEDPAAD